MGNAANPCAECSASPIPDESAIRCGDVFELARPAAVYAWSAAEGRALGSHTSGTRIIAIDQLPPRWWKVAVQANRWRAVIDDDSLEPTQLYPNLSAPEFKRVGALCPRHTNDLVAYFRPRTDLWRG